MKLFFMNVFSDRDLAFGNYWQVSPLQYCKKKKKKSLQELR